MSYKVSVFNPPKCFVRCVRSSILATVASANFRISGYLQCYEIVEKLLKILESFRRYLTNTAF